MKVAIHQPNYLPWCGYFAKLNACDTFIFLDDAQMTKGSYINRARIRSADGERWLTIPAKVQNAPLIGDVAFADDTWPRKHFATLRQTYARAPFMEDVIQLLEPIYGSPGPNLSDFNKRLIEAFASYLGIKREIRSSSSLAVEATSDDRLIELVRKVGGDRYLSGPGGSNYQDPAKFAAASIDLETRSYLPLPYETKRFPFMPGLSIIDALFIRGPGAIELLRYTQ